MNRSYKRRKRRGGTTRKNNGVSKVQCAPKEKGQMNDFSCYTNDSLIKLKNLWNARHPHESIQSNDPKEIHALLTKYMKNVCNTESCWLKQEFIAGKVDTKLKNSFAPKSPEQWKKNPHEWLSSLDIIHVMKQYEAAYKCFDFIGPSPIDFDTKLMYGKCVWDELCNFNLANEIKKGKFKIGITFNTDTHDKPGEHWISLFINIKKKCIFFFDSAGDKAPPEILAFVHKVKKQGQDLGINFVFDQNYPVEHQKGDSACGMYSLYFIIYMLEDKINGKYLKTHIIPDKHVDRYRKIFFNEDL